MWRLLRLSLVIQTVLLYSLCDGRMDCAQSEFDDSSTKHGKIYCGPGFHECGYYGDACCNDIDASPVQLVLVILGPTSVMTSLVLVGFVVKTIINTIREDKALTTIKPNRGYKETQ